MYLQTHTTGCRAASVSTSILYHDPMTHDHYSQRTQAHASVPPVRVIAVVMSDIPGELRLWQIFWHWVHGVIADLASPSAPQPRWLLQLLLASILCMLTKSRLCSSQFPGRACIDQTHALPPQDLGDHLHHQDHTRRWDSGAKRHAGVWETSHS